MYLMTTKHHVRSVSASITAVVLFASSALAAQNPIVLRPDRVFDGNEIQEAWAVVVRGEHIVAAGPASKSVCRAELMRSI